jgi:hypothetical protein
MSPAMGTYTPPTPEAGPALPPATAKEGSLIRTANRRHRLFARLAPLLLLLALPGAARAQELYSYSLGLLGGIGGSPDAEPGDGFGNTGYQLNLGMLTERRTLVSLRAGQLTLDQEDRFGSFTDADLTYATIGGEYKFRETFYDSGLFVALGGYRLQGDDGFGGDRDDTSLGLSIGATGEFRLNRYLGILIELSGHVVDLEEVQFFGMAHGGLSVHF